LSPPLLWFLVIYLSSLVLMLITSFWSVNDFTSQIDHQLTGSNFAQISAGAYPSIILRTVLLAALVTLTDALVALPFAYVMARVATQRSQRLLLGAVLLPLWASYLAKVYAWISILEKGGALNWTFSKLGLPDPNLGFTNGAMWIAFCYIWLPYMIVPIYGSLERIPNSLLDASADLGGSSWSTFRRVILPLIAPGLGSGAFLAFMASFDNVPVSLFLADERNEVLPIHLWQQIDTNLDVRTAAASGLIVIFTLALMLIAERFAGFTRRMH
jgi:putative spermidine/putrescine transport system permease protein